MAIPEHPEPFPIENHVRIVALTPDLQRVSFHNLTDLLSHSTTTKRIPSLIVLEESIRALKPGYCIENRQELLWLL